MSFGKGGGGSSQPAGNTTSTQTSTPWVAQQPLLEKAFGQASGLYNDYSPQYFPTSTVAPFNPTQQAGLSAETQFGQQGGSSSVGAANGGLSTINSGALVNSGNPFFQNMVSQIGQAIQPQIDSQFAQNGRYGSGANANAFASSLANQAGQLGYQNYNDQINNVIKGAAVAPGIQSAQLQGIGALQDAGNQQQQQSQAQLNDQINRFNFQQQLPYNKLANFQSMIQGNYGGTSTLTQPYFQNKGANALGGALGGGALGGLIGNQFGYGGAGKGLGSLAGLSLA